MRDFRKSQIEDIWVKVDPARQYVTPDNAARIKRDAEEIVEQIDRHVDAHSAQVVIERTSVCPDCGAAWTEDSGIYNGGCCNQDAVRGIVYKECSQEEIEEHFEHNDGMQERVTAYRETDEYKEAIAA